MIMRNGDLRSGAYSSANWVKMLFSELMYWRVTDEGGGEGLKWSVGVGVGVGAEAEAGVVAGVVTTLVA